MVSNPYTRLLAQVWKHGLPWRKSIIGFYLAYILAQVFMSLIPYTFGKMLDVLQNYSPVLFKSLLFWMITGILLLPVFWLFHGPARIVERTVAMKIYQRYLLELYQKLLNLPLRWHQQHHAGKIVAQIQRSSQSLRQFSEDQFIYIETIIKFIVSIFFLFGISPLLGFFSLVSCWISFVIVIFYDRMLVPLYKAENKQLNYINTGFYDYLTKSTTLLTLRLSEYASQNLHRRLEGLWPSYKKRIFINEVKWGAMGIFLSTLQSLILIAYIFYTIKHEGAVMIGSVAMIARYQQELSDVFFTLSLYYSDLVRMNTDLEDIIPLL